MPGLDQNVETHPNGSIGASDKLLKVPTQQTNGKVAENTDKPADENPTADVVVPLDGGWGWVVVYASFLCCVIVDGIVMGAVDSLTEHLTDKTKNVGADKTQVIFTSFSCYFLDLTTVTSN